MKTLRKKKMVFYSRACEAGFVDDVVSQRPLLNFFA